jgi:transcriptional regulator with XRE-family HTH domain
VVLTNTPVDGQKLRHMRLSRGMTQLSLANAAGITQITLSNIERGCYPTSQPKSIYGLARALRVTPEEITAERARWNSPVYE